MTSTTTPRATRREWVGLAVIALPCLLYSMDLEVLHLAVPALSADLRPSSAQLLWIVDVYGFLLAGSLITMGTLGDRIGRRRLLLIGAAAFGVTSVLAAYAPSAEWLVVARALLGVAGATLAPSTLSLIRNMFLDDGQRTVAVSVWATCFSVGAAIGPLVGGVLLEHFWWGSVFLVSVPIMVLLLVLGPLLLPESKDPDAGRLDLTSAALSVVAVLAVVYGLKSVASDGVGVTAVGVVALGLLVAVVFVARQRRLAHPLVDLRLFRVPAFSASLAVNLFAIFAAFGVTFYLAQYFQLVAGLSPLVAGLWTLPSACALVVGSLGAPWLVRRTGPAYAMAGGLVLAAAGALLLTRVGTASSLWLLVVGATLLLLGVAPVVTLSTDLIVSSAPPERAGSASSLSETGAELGGALGIAVLGSLATAVYRGGIADGVPAGLPPAAAEAARDTLGAALAVAGELPAPLAAEVLDAARAAFTSGLVAVSAAAAAVLVGLAIVVAVVLRTRSR